MTKAADLVPLRKYAYEDVADLIDQGITGQIQTFIINTRSGGLIQLHPGQIQKVISCHPNPTILNLVGHYVERVSYGDLRIHKDNFTKIDTREQAISDPDNSALVALGALIKLVLETSSSKVGTPLYASQNEIEQAIADKYYNKRGLSVSSLQKIFPRANETFLKAKEK